MAFKFTRAIYKKIKKFDQKDMNEFLQSVWLQGYNKGSNKENIDYLESIQKLEKVLKETKGVGPAISQRILEKWIEVGNETP